MSRSIALAAFWILINGATCAAQTKGLRYDNYVLQNSGGVAQVGAGATITVCLSSATGTPCSPTTPIYGDEGLTSPLSNPLTADSNGVFGFYAPSGSTYKITITGTGLTSRTIIWTAPSVTENIVHADQFPGSTADAQINAACRALPTSGGTVDLRGFGTMPQTIAAGITDCSSKQATFLVDAATRFNITVADHSCVFALGNGSGVLGLGGGQINGPISSATGFWLSSSAAVQAVFCNANMVGGPGGQEAAYVQGIVAGSVAPNPAAVDKAIVYFKQLATNTYIQGNNFNACPSACIWLENIGGQAKVENNWINVQSGSPSITGSGLVIRASGSGPGVKISNIAVLNNTIEHAGGNSSASHEIDISGDDIGSTVAQVNFSNVYVERTNVTSAAPNIAIRVRDCNSCRFDNMSAGGTGTGSDFINVSQSASGRSTNVSVVNVGSPLGFPYSNALNDTVNGVVLPSANYKTVANYGSEYTWTGFYPGTLTTLNNWINSFVPSYPITVTRVILNVQSYGSGCTTLPVVTITNGTASARMAVANLNNGNASPPMVVRFDAGSLINMELTTTASGCSLIPADMNVTVQYQIL